MTVLTPSLMTPAMSLMHRRNRQQRDKFQPLSSARSAPANVEDIDDDDPLMFVDADKELHETLSKRRKTKVYKDFSEDTFAPFEQEEEDDDDGDGIRSVGRKDGIHEGSSRGS